MWGVVEGAPEIHFQALVDVLHLPVRLRVIGGGVHQLGACRGEQFAPHGTSEDLVPIRDDGERHAVQLDDVVSKCAGDVDRGEGVPERHKVRELSHAIDNDHDGIVPFRFG